MDTQERDLRCPKLRGWIVIHPAPHQGNYAMRSRVGAAGSACEIRIFVCERNDEGWKVTVIAIFSKGEGGEEGEKKKNWQIRVELEVLGASKQNQSNQIKQNHPRRSSPRQADMQELRRWCAVWGDLSRWSLLGKRADTLSASGRSSGSAANKAQHRLARTPACTSAISRFSASRQNSS
eukprot:EG_transcript_17103